MRAYGKYLQSLIDFTGVKLYSVAEAAGYDVSYISKWCKKDLLPSARVSADVNRELAAFFAAEILTHGDRKAFTARFGIEADPENRAALESALYEQLQDCYLQSGKRKTADPALQSPAMDAGADPQTMPYLPPEYVTRMEGIPSLEQDRSAPPGSLTAARLLLEPSEIRRFWIQEVPALLRRQVSDSMLQGQASDSIGKTEKPAEILCSMDLCKLLQNASLQEPFLPETDAGAKDSAQDMPDVHLTLTVDMGHFHEQHTDLLPALYHFLGLNNRISIELVENDLLAYTGLFLIRGILAAYCSLDAGGNVLSLCVLYDPRQVERIYDRIQPLFSSSNALLKASDGMDFHRRGYRMDFYTRDHFQILLAEGFEFLLPEDCTQSILEAAKESHDDGRIALSVSRLLITFEEIFEHASVDFFLLKSSLLRYLETGEILFTDFACRLSPAQRKSHIRNILEICHSNPDITFYLIDDERLPGLQHRASLSVFNNRKKAFLKNPSRFSSGQGPRFYSVSSDILIQDLTDYLDGLKESPHCTRYDGASLQAIYERYASLLNRMIDLSECE